MLGIAVRENEDLVQADSSVQFRDHMVDERRVRRVTLYWYACSTGNYGPNGFTADYSIRQDCWLVRAVSGISVKKLLPGEITGEGALAEAAREIFEEARKEATRGQEHRGAQGHEAGFGL